MTTRKSLLTEENFARVVVGFVTVGFIAIVVAAAAAGWAQWRNQQYLEAIDHTRTVESRISDFSTLIERAETARRGYLVRGAFNHRQAYEEAVAPQRPLLDEIAALTADNAAQQRRVAETRALLAEQLAFQQQTITLIDQGRFDEAIAQFRNDPSITLTRQLRERAAAMLGEEGRLLGERNAAQTRAADTLFALAALAGILLLIVAAAAVTAIRRYTTDLATSRSALRALNENLEDAVEERTVDLQRANDEIQRFAYIVSHDLRSPLVNVMGFTAELDTARQQITRYFDEASANDPELAKSDAAIAAHEDLPEAIGFIRSSTQKMDRLINAILQLSRQGRRTLAPEPIDMNAMVLGIADMLQHRTSEAGAEIRIEGKLPAIETDRLAIEQIFQNLIENAVKYLKPGRAGVVTVRGRRDGKRLLYEVEDNGRGIDPRDHERVFDLFRRSGQQDQPGEGIGLAHVRALAYRLGGLISCESELDRGALFRLSLPPKFQAGEGVSQ
ncbi:sensor histidine kinase [Allosphingosinicella indica]|uniref:sensor histidine kinase n=1 Tax=Allosphingosinicella indica TaxID=941907 RepID=UPI001FCD766B|nr:sensor histidine kinase [Allosphingosinicella indica]